MNPLAVPKHELVAASRIPTTILKDSDAIIQQFAHDLVSDFLAAKSRGRQRVLFIVPVGPVGQFELMAQLCNESQLSLRDLVVINMDEYLQDDGLTYISLDDPLSFRRHMADRFYSRLNPSLAPPAEHRVFPDPRNPGRIGEIIAECNGVDVAYCGVGINGHLAFNDPPEPDEDNSLAAVRNSPTRVVRLTRETRLINSVTASRGNIDRIPKLAVTVGMHDILGSHQIRVYMNRLWQAAIARKILCGPVTAAVPASLLQEHPSVHVTIADYVAELPEPTLA